MTAIRELVRIVELLAKIQGELKEPGGTTVNVVYVNALGKLDKPGAPTARSEIVDLAPLRPAEVSEG
jgi:hypothetical protein